MSAAPGDMHCRKCSVACATRAAFVSLLFELRHQTFEESSHCPAQVEIERLLKELGGRDLEALRRNVEAHWEGLVVHAAVRPERRLAPRGNVTTRPFAIA